MVASGFMVAQLFVVVLRQAMIQWNLGATTRRANGTSQQGEYAFTMTFVPAPAGIAAFHRGPAQTWSAAALRPAACGRQL